MILPTTGDGDPIAKAFGDAVKPGRVASKQPSDGAYGVIGYVRKGSTDGHKRLCIENAPKWVNA